MYLPLMFSEDGELSCLVRSSTLFLMRLARCFDELLSDVQVPFDPTHPKASLARYHRGRGQLRAPRDWGLTAQLTSLIRKRPIQELLLQTAGFTAERLQALHNSLHQALSATFDGFHDHPEIFLFTQSLSFSSALEFYHPAEVETAELRDLDDTINKLVKDGVTEQKLDPFLREQIIPAIGPAAEDDINSAALRDMLLEKLQAGEYAKALDWPETRRQTIDFYDRTEGDQYAERYGNTPVTYYVDLLRTFVEGRTLTNLRALDLACGPGQYAQLLTEQGCQVELYDASAQMLKYAAERLKLTAPRGPRDYFNIEREIRAEEFDLVFACAMMVHVPVELAPDVYRQLHRILKPNGLLFINFKLGDHSGISLGGRFYQYYRDDNVPTDMLENAGLRVVASIESRNRVTSQGAPQRSLGQLLLPQSCGRL